MNANLAHLIVNGGIVFIYESVCYYLLHGQVTIGMEQMALRMTFDIVPFFLQVPLHHADLSSGKVL